MFDRPVLIMPIPDGMRGYNGGSSISTLLLVGLCAFIYLDQKYGIDNVLGKQKMAQVSTATVAAKNTSVGNDLTLVSHDDRPTNVAPTQATTTLVSPAVEKRATPTTTLVSPAVEKRATTTTTSAQPTRSLRVVTDNTKVRTSPEIVAGNVQEILDVNERVLYVNHSDFTETFRNKAGQDVTGYWFCIFRPRTNSYGWVHQVNLEIL